MTVTFTQLIAFTCVLMGFGLVMVTPFLIYLFNRDRRERQAAKEMGDSCHAFQRESSAQTTKAFNAVVDALTKNSEALVRNSEVIKDFDRLRGNVRT